MISEISLEQKVHVILKTLITIEERMNKIDDKFDFNDRLEKVKTKCEKIENDLSSKSRVEVVEELTERANGFTNKIRDLEEFQSNYQKICHHSGMLPQALKYSCSWCTRK